MLDACQAQIANVCKSLGKEKCKGTLAEAAVSQIALIYHTDNTLSDLKPEERSQKRELLVKPLVEAFFAWVKSNQDSVPAKSETGKGFNYCLNQEKYLRAFLIDPAIPLDNNDAEIAIRSFCIGKRENLTCFNISMKSPCHYLQCCKNCIFYCNVYFFLL